MGHSTLGANTVGYSNSAFGAYALDACTDGDNNTAAGHNALGACTGGRNNNAFGVQALRDMTTGNQNVAMGGDALQGVTTGDYNIGIGHDAGRSNSPSGNITTGNYNIVLGNNDTANLYCADTSISSSDSRDKTDITDFTKGLDWIKALRPVTYRWDKRSWYGSGVEGESDEFLGTPDGSKKRTKLHVGFLAQEALEIEKANGYGSSKDDMLVVNLNEDETAYGMKYERLVPVLVNAIKELSAEVEQLKSQLNN